MTNLELLKSQTQNLKLDCEFWDVRIEDLVETTIDILDGEVLTCSTSPSRGAFLRVRKNGFWLYESTTRIEQIGASLEQLAKSKSNQSSKNVFSPKKQPHFSSLRFAATNVALTPLAEKLTLLESYAQFVKKAPDVVASQTRYSDVYKIKAYLNSVGTEYEYDFNQAGVFVKYTLKKDDSRFDDYLKFYSQKFLELKNREEDIQNHLSESRKFISAPAITPGKYKVLLNPEVTGVFTHESFGHKSEADFMIGDDKALEDWKIGTVIGHPHLTIVDYGLHPQTSGYCPVDDEGTPARKNYLIKNGVLAGRLHTIDTAAQLKEEPTGNARAINFEFEPIVRMTSTYIEPGTESLESILKKSKGAILVEGVRHGSGLSTFTIAPVRGYLIGENGQKTPVRLSVISGSVFETLKNIEAISTDFKLDSSAFGGCGKMSQWPLPVADGGPYVLVKNMQVS